MDLQDLIKTRRMTRSFLSQPVEIDKVKQALTLSYYAPSAGNTNGLYYIVLSNPQLIKRFWQITSDASWLQSIQAKKLTAAPIIVIPAISPKAYQDRYKQEDKKRSKYYKVALENWPVPYWYVDAGAALMIVLLTLEHFGLGALFFAIRNNYDNLLKELGINPPDNELLLLGAIAIGYPQGLKAPKRHKRKPQILEAS
jgi:nitroreductase